VQIVLLLLFVASVVSWTMIYQRTVFYMNAQRALDAFENDFWSGIDLGELYRKGTKKVEVGGLDGVENIFRAGFKEFTRLCQQKNADPDAVMEGTQRAMRVALSREEEKLERHLPFLASTARLATLMGALTGSSLRMIRRRPEKVMRRRRGRRIRAGGSGPSAMWPPSRSARTRS